MNRFFLTFKDTNIERQYQDQKLKIIIKPICYLLLLASFALNFVKVLLDFTIYQKPNNSWMNVALLILVVIETFIVWHKQEFIKYALFISNITVGLLQINFDENNTLPQEYYYYGSNISMFSTAVYLISDFSFGVIEIIIHLGMKIFFTTYKSGRVDITGMMLGFTTSGFMILTLYISDWNARRQFLFNLREIKWEESLPTIIRKPFYLFSFEEKRLSFQVKKQFKHEMFPYFNEEECYGCNFRQFLRKCKYYKNNLEIYLFENNGYENINKKISYKNKSQRFDIRVCSVGIDQNLYLLILEKIENYSQNFIPKDTNIRQKLFCSLKKQLKFPHQKHYLLGVFTMFLYQNYEISKINLVEILEKFSHNYQIYSNKILCIIYTQKSSYELITYKNQLVIFLIQLFDCIINSCQNNQQDSKFILHQELHVIKVKLLVQDKILFKEFYNENFFIQEIQKNILQEEPDERNVLSFIKKVQNNQQVM